MLMLVMLVLGIQMIKLCFIFNMTRLHIITYCTVRIVIGTSSWTAFASCMSLLITFQNETPAKEQNKRRENRAWRGYVFAVHYSPETMTFLLVDRCAPFVDDGGWRQKKGSISKFEDREEQWKTNRCKIAVHIHQEVRLLVYPFMSYTVQFNSKLYHQSFLGAGWFERWFWILRQKSPKHCQKSIGYEVPCIHVWIASFASQKKLLERFVQIMLQPENISYIDHTAGEKIIIKHQQS